jgi:hypothetical protein
MNSLGYEPVMEQAEERDDTNQELNSSPPTLLARTPFRRRNLRL